MQDLSKTDARELISACANYAENYYIARSRGDTPEAEEQAAGYAANKKEILRRLALTPQWLPIEQAPKDGTRIIAIAYGNVHHINTIWWDRDNWQDGTSRGPDMPTHFTTMPSLSSLEESPISYSDSAGEGMG